MIKSRYFTGRAVFLSSLALVLAAGSITARAADPADSPDNKQRKFVAVLQSDAAPGDKAIACKQLAIYGTSDAVPVLAPLLADPQLASWARIALETIPGPAADTALRDALGRAQGRLLIGVINSLGVRRDAAAIEVLLAKLKDADTEVASAAAVALGKIGGGRAAEGLLAVLASAPGGVRPAVAEGSILCAEHFLAGGKAPDAVKLYDRVCSADVPRQLVLEATRGAILSRGPAGVPMLLEQLRSPDKDRFDMALRTARELPGRDVTEALAAAWKQSPPDRQARVLLAVADRKDSAVLPGGVDAARSGPPKLRMAAVGVLERLGGVSSVPVLLDAATTSDPDVARSATAVLARLPGLGVDADLLARLPQASGKSRQVLVTLAGRRRMAAALPTVVQCTQDADAATRSAAVQALGAIGGAKQIGDLTRLLQKAPDGKDRDDIEKALAAIGGRGGRACVPELLPLMRSEDSAVRIVGLHTLAVVGGPDALAAVKSAVEDRQEGVQDEAVRTLSTWPNNWPEDTGVAEPLLTLARSGKKLSHQVLGLRGYLLYVQEDRKLKNDEKVTRITEVRPLLKRPDEARLAIAALGTIPAFSALDTLVTFTADPDLAEDACSAIVNIAGRNLEGASPGQPQKALQTVLQTSKNEATKRKAGRILQGSK